VKVPNDVVSKKVTSWHESNLKLYPSTFIPLTAVPPHDFPNISDFLRTSIAYQKETTSFSPDALLVVDGDIRTEVNIAPSAEHRDAWLTVDLGAGYLITGVAVYPGASSKSLKPEYPNY